MLTENLTCFILGDSILFISVKASVHTRLGERALTFIALIVPLTRRHPFTAHLHIKKHKNKPVNPNRASVSEDNKKKYRYGTAEIKQPYHSAFCGDGAVERKITKTWEGE